jgi:hypothetical protein
VKKLCQLEDENRRLKEMVAEQALDNQALKTLTAKTGIAQGETSGGSGPRSITMDHGRLRIGPICVACNWTLFDQANTWRVPLLSFLTAKLRDECLNVHPFAPMAEAQNIIEA